MSSPERCSAEYHWTAAPSQRCELPAGHEREHGNGGFVWTTTPKPIHSCGRPGALECDHEAAASHWQEQARQAEAALAAANAENERLRVQLTTECSCGKTYATYEGPEPDCPVHGAVRAFNEASAENERLREQITAQRSLNEQYVRRFQYHEDICSAREQAVLELADQWEAYGFIPAADIAALRRALSADPTEETL